MYFHIAHVALRSNVLHTLRHNVLHVLSHRSRCSTLMYTTSSCIVRRRVFRLTLNLTYHTSSCLTTYMRPFPFSCDDLSSPVHFVHSAHVDGLSALYIHENLGIEMVMEAFVRYMAFVKDKIHPNKAYVDTTWFTEK